MNAPDSIHASRTPDRDINDLADGELRAQAIENLSEKLKSGKSVGRCCLRDLIDCELNSDRSAIVLEEFEGLLLNNEDRNTRAEKILDGFIERYLNDPKRLDLIEEECAEIEHAEEEDHGVY